MTFSRMVVSAVVPMMVACGSDDGGVRSQVPDALPDGMELCAASSTYNPMMFPIDVQTVADYPAKESGDLHSMFFSAPLAAFDFLYIDLYEQYGAFAGTDIMPGTYTIAGDDTAYSTCGLCITISGNETVEGVDDWYMATSGTVTLQSVANRFKGTLSDVVLVRVKTDDAGAPSDIPTNDCMTRIISASFNVEIVPVML